MTELDARVAQLTRHYVQWQGLRWVPVGVGAILAGVVLAGAAAGGGSAFVLLLIAALVLVGVDPWIADYYDRRFGQVRDMPSRRLTFQRVGRYLAFVPVAVVAVIEVNTHPPVLFSGLLVGALVVAFWWVTGRGRWHWPVLAAAPALTAFLPTLGVTDPGLQSLAVLLIVAGVVEIIGGVLDHLVLLARIREVRDGLSR